MITTDYIMKVIEASEGLMLTQKADVKIEDRIISKRIYLGSNDSDKNWTEITSEKAAEIIAEKERLAAEARRRLEEEEKEEV